MPALAAAKIYIDITSPERRVPIAISPLAGLSGGEISSVVKDDLDATGLFVFLDEKGFTESPTQPFNRNNWLSTSVVCVLKGKVNFSPDGQLEAVASLYDVQTGGALFTKRYNAPVEMLRPLAHAIASDVYTELTGSKTSPFRSRLSFIVEHKGIKDMEIADWDGKRARPLGFKERMLMPPRWSRDGETLYYSASRGMGWKIYSISLKSMKEKLVFAKPGTGIMGDVDAAGDIVFSSSFQGSPNIYVLKPGGTLQRLTKSYGIDVSPAYSPDGRRIAYVSDREGTPQIYIMDAGGYNSARISFSGNYNTSPSWSPDGERIVFAGRYQGLNQIFTVKADGSDPMMLTSAGDNEDPCFSPDGSMIAFTSKRDGRRAVYIMRANGEGQKRITPPGVVAYGPKWH